VLLVAPGLALSASLRAHEVVYHFAFHGLSGGDLKLTLKHDAEPEHWIYETRADPSFLARLVVSGDSLERSWFRVTPTGVEPMRYKLDDGTPKHGDDAELRYDWERGRVSGTVRGGALDLATEPGLQDVMSIRAAPMADLLAGREPHEYAMLDGREIKHYIYSRHGTAKIKTVLGDLETVIIDSDRKGADSHARMWRYWYAPSLNWLPVRIEQREDGQTRMALTVRSLKWLEPAAPSVPASTPPQ
jgi:hypothetical protein